METAEDIERQITAQVEKFQEADRQEQIFEQSETYKAWDKSSSDEITVRLVLWPNTPRKETMLVTITKHCGPPEWSCKTEEEFLAAKGLKTI